MTDVHPGAFVDPKAQLGPGVRVGPGAVIGPHVRLGEGTTVGSHALITGWTRVGAGCTLHHGAVLGSAPQDLKYRPVESYLEIGDRTEIREYATLNVGTEAGAATRVGSDCLLMAYTHVAHNCHLGDRVVVANCVQFAGYVTVEDWVIVGGGTMVHQFVRIGRHAMVGGMSRVSQDVAPYIKIAGTPPRPAGVNAIGLERRGFPRERRDALDRAYRLLFRDGRPMAEAVEAMREAFPHDPDVEHLARFAETTTRGLSR